MKIEESLTAYSNRLALLSSHIALLQIAIADSPLTPGEVDRLDVLAGEVDDATRAVLKDVTEYQIKHPS